MNKETYEKIKADIVMLADKINEILLKADLTGKISFDEIKEIAKNMKDLEMASLFLANMADLHEKFKDALLSFDKAVMELVKKEIHIEGKSLEKILEKHKHE